IKRDASKPTIVSDITGTLGNNGWYVTDVTVSWTVIDADSGITSAACPPTTISSDTPGTDVSCSATNGAGLSDTASVAIKRDAHAPVVNPGDVINTTWRNTLLSVLFSASDTPSGLAN